jgi:O-antigen/teichoic acid export membrane protein
MRKVERETAAEAALGPPSPVEVLDTPEAGPIAIRGSAMRTAGYMAGVLLSAASAPLMIRHLGVVDFGRYVTVISIVMIVAAVTDVGLTNIGVREYSVREASERRRLIQNLLGMRVVLTCGGVLAAGALAGVAGYPSVVLVGTLVAGAGLLMNVVQSTYQVPLAAGLRLGWITAIEFLRQFVTVALIVTLVIVGAALLPFFATTVAAGLGVLVLTIALVRHEVPFLPAAELPEWWGLLRDALAYGAATAIGVIYFRVEIVLISLISTEEEAGYFSASFRILEILGGIPWVISLSVFPILVRAARDDRSRLRYALQRLFEVSTIAGVWVGLALVVGAEVAIEIVAGEGFDRSVEVLQIMGASMLATFLISTWGFALLSLRRHAALLLANGLALLLAVGLTFALVPAEGAPGAAIAVTATEFVLALSYALLLMRRRRDLRVSVSVLPRVALAAGLALALAYLSGVSSAAAVALATVVYLAVLLALRAIPREVFDAFGLGKGQQPPGTA